MFYSFQDACIDGTVQTIRLNLANNGLTDNCIEILGNLIRYNPTIVQLDISQNNFTYKGLVKLLKALLPSQNKKEKWNKTISKISLQDSNLQPSDYGKIKEIVDQVNSKRSREKLIIEVTRAENGHVSVIK
jgi:hypothetical protein